MKTRSGFVSNSSSSSFIIACKERPVVKIEIDMAKLADRIIKNEEDLNNFFVGEYCWGNETLKDVFHENPELEIRYVECLACINDGNTIYVGQVANDYGDPEAEFLYNSGFDKENTNFTTIEGI